MSIERAKTITRQAARPTSVVIMLLILQAVTLAAPQAIPERWEDFAVNAITVVGGTGILDKAWRNRKEIKEWVRKIFKKKDHE
jgi:hypothetical protein